MHNIKFIIILFFYIFLTVFMTQSVSADTIAETSAVSVSAVVGGGVITITPSGGGVGTVQTSVSFSGFAYPGAVVHLLKDGISKMTKTANDRGIFNITLDESYNPNVLYTLYAIDKSNRSSVIINYPVVVKSGYLTQISGIRFSPTIVIDKTEVKAGDYLSVSGYALPNEQINIEIEGLQQRSFSIISNNEGLYKITVPLLDLKQGNYNLYVNYENDKRISKVVKFVIGELNILNIDLTINIPGDCNSDQIINLIDFSVMAFWYKKSNPIQCVDTNKDNIINLVDLSILAFYWTG